MAGGETEFTADAEARSKTIEAGREAGTCALISDETVHRPEW